MLLLIIEQSMGNMCCEEDQQTGRNRKEIVPSHYRNVAEYQQSRNEHQQYAQTQKNLLREFSIAVIKLKRSAQERSNRMYKGVYTHSSISCDEISEYFAATLVQENDDFKACVVKKIRKERVVSQYLKRSLSIEYLVTSYHHSNFIVKNLHFYEDYTYLCLYFDLTHFVHLNIFTHSPLHQSFFRNNLEIHIRFVIAGVILALEQLHNLQIVYRGINNENIVIRENGYPLITNLSNLHPEGHPPVIVPASPFVSPEEFKGQPITRSADLWALGVLIFHMITNNYPDFSHFQEGTFNAIGITPQLTDLVNKLLRFNPQERLGVHHLNDLKAHAFFFGFDWRSYSNLELPSPLSIQQNSFPKQAPAEQQYDYHQKENFDYNGYSFGGGGMMMMAGLLFLQLGSLYMISSLFERQHLYDEHSLQEQAVPALLQEEGAPQLPSNEFQEGCAFQLSEGSNGSPEDAGIDGDYD